LTDSVSSEERSFIIGDADFYRVDMSGELGRLAVIEHVFGNLGRIVHTNISRFIGRKDRGWRLLDAALGDLRLLGNFRHHEHRVHRVWYRIFVVSTEYRFSYAIVANGKCVILTFRVDVVLGTVTTVE
jgi:hypothetical protein